MVLQALNEMKIGPSEVSLELIAASGGVGILLMTEICLSPSLIWNAS